MTFEEAIMGSRNSNRVLFEFLGIFRVRIKVSFTLVSLFKSFRDLLMNMLLLRINTSASRSWSSESTKYIIRTSHTIWYLI